MIIFIFLKHTEGTLENANGLNDTSASDQTVHLLCDCSLIV